MAKQDYEFTLILSGVRELTGEVLDAFYEAGCDDALIGMRDGTAYAEFGREADSFQQAALSAIHNVETAGVGARVEHVEPDELVTMSEIARRLNVTREGVRKWVSGTRGPGTFPPPAGCLTQRSPLWHWTDVVRWYNEYQQRERAEMPEHVRAADTNVLVNQGPHIATLNAALDLRRRVSLEEAMRLLQRVGRGGSLMDKPLIRDRLIAVAQALAAEKRAELERLKEGYSGLARPDFIWHYLLQSFSTMGRASGWNGLIGNQVNYRRITYDVLAELTPQAREAQVKEVCEAAASQGLRRHKTKAKYILGCFEHVRQLGGPEAAKAQLLVQPGREGKICFLKSFPGIGDKYARNILMDVYHEEFRDSIAVDDRIKKISKGLGLSFASYAEHEAFYLDVARRAGLNGWELDRLLFNFRPEVEARLDVIGATTGEKTTNLEQQAGEAMELTQQTVGNIGLYYVCYRLSRLGWNVMPTSRNARGVDILAYNRDASRRPTIQVKALRKRDAVGLGKNFSHLIADFLIVCRYVERETPECFVLTRAEVERLAVRDKGDAKGESKRAYWLAARDYEAAGFREKWERINAAQAPTGI